MKLQIKNQILSKISSVLNRENIKYSYEVWNKQELLVHINRQHFLVDVKTNHLTIKESAYICLFSKKITK